MNQVSLKIEYQANQRYVYQFYVYLNVNIRQHHAIKLNQLAVHYIQEVKLNE